jgi:chromosome partitioning protein
MEKEKGFSVGDVEKIFHLKEKINSRQTLLNLEERGEIPKAQRLSRGKNGKIQQRFWSAADLVGIGEKIGFLPKPTKQHRIVFNISKGGNLKTSQAYNWARMMALSGIKVLAIPLDIQKSFTKLLSNEAEVEDISQVQEEGLGLYHLLFEGAPLEEVVQKTDLPTLDFIPETSELNILEKRLRMENRKEYVFADRLMPKLKDYDVVLFDTAPSFSSLIENAITTATEIVSPVGCEVGSYQVLEDYLAILNEFFEVMQIEPEHYLIPVLLDKNKISQQIYSAYVSRYSDKIIATPIRRSVVAQEAAVLQQSVFEYSPDSPLAGDQYEAITEFWKRALANERSN